jgi:hypothetical protein
MDEPYFVEIDENGCAKCGVGRMWTVIGPDGTQHQTSFADEDDAARLAEDLNDAYYRGKHEKQREMRKARKGVSKVIIPPASSSQNASKDDHG